MRMRAFKSHGMNRVIARAVSHAVNDHYRYNRSSGYTSSSSSSNSDANVGSLVVMFFILFLVLAACETM
jgi:hypothetical protein